MNGGQIGRSLRRLEDPRFLTGQGRYVDDMGVPGQLHAFVLRSPHGHAAIDGIDTVAARAMPGVRGVFTAADLEADGIGPLPCIAQVATLAPIIAPPRRALALGRVRHVGDPVAFVVADTKDAARDAAEMIRVAYRPLPAVVDGAAALRLGAPCLWDEAPGNLAYRFERGDKRAVEAALAGAAHIVEIELVNNRLVVAPIEPRAAIGDYDGAADRLELLLTGQGVHSLRQQLATAVFHMPPDRIQVRAPDVGGGFGVKNFLYPEWVLVLWAARRLGRPVKWVAERGEEFVSSAQGRDNRTRARLALDKDGRFLALEVDTVANLGAYLSTNGPGSSTNSPASAMGGVYAIPAVFMAVRGAFTNTVPIDAYRGAGKPEANYLIERLVDRAARRLKLDPVGLRRRNLISRFPYKSGLGVTIDCGRFAANLDEMAERVLTGGFAARRQEAAERGKLRGLGIACFLETSRGTPGERAEIRFEGDGCVALVLGTQSNGQGHETSFPQIAADLLGLPVDAFRFVQADTDEVKTGNGHGGARSMHMGGAALYQAAQMVISKGRAIAAHLLQADAEEVSFGAGRFTVGGGERGIDLLALAAAARDPANLPEDMSPGLDADAYNDCDVFTFPNGCHAAEIEIDPETGAVTLLRYVAIDDYGRLINPMLTVGQVQGGLAQGIGQALLEHTVYDDGSGQLLSGSLLDYALPRADDLPPLDITLAELPTSVNPLGVKGAGQAGCIAAPQTIVNAILDALAPLGIEHIDMPATPERIWRAIQSARPGWQFWIDRGGTFTDIVARAPDGSLIAHKLLSQNPDRYRDAAIAGIKTVLGLPLEAPIPPGLVEAVKMGTTVATNALLERHGERTLLVVNRGFADALRIGNQTRPRLFDLDIRLPGMLYERVVEIGGRVAIDGSEIEALDEAGAARAFAEARAAGINACAILLMHAWKFPEHERRLTALAQAAGFTQVSASHRVSALLRLVPRGDTTVVDAYLSPILRRYVDQVAAELRGVRLYFMQSSGGLADAASFQGKDAILSGPAGGIVGAARTASAAGFDHIISFDMGGTSTDVALYAGEFERAFETQVAGVRMRAPMMAINTVAAGGGSILNFDGARFRVGPESAGADPGPASYRRGGPLTVTDANLCVGKIQPAHFPAIFGSSADQPLDGAVVAAKFAALADEIARATGEPQDPRAVAEGFLRVAVGNMANAIKQVSVQKGHDATRFALQCFGGAGGQHACLVADELGMETVFIHPYAGVLSAYGMGLADQIVMREQAVEVPFGAGEMAGLEALAQRLAQEAGAALAAQGAEPERIEVRHVLHLRYAGTDTALIVPYGAPDRVVPMFTEAHRARFGFATPERPLVVEALAVEATAAGEKLRETRVPGRDAGAGGPEPVDRVAMWTGGAEHVAPVFDRTDLRAGDRIAGPALIREANATTVASPDGAPR